jgi:hypothetical protein
MRFPILISPPWRPLLAVLGMRRGSCFAELDPERKTLRIKGGVWFDETLPLAEVVEVRASSWPWYGGLGVKLGPTSDAVSVVGSTQNVVAIRFRAPQRVRAVVAVRRSELRVSLEDPQAFREALARALTAQT